MKNVTIVIIGIIIGSKLPQGFFQPWWETNMFFGGEMVRHATDGPDSDGAEFYNACTNGKVLHVHDQKHIWVHWTGCGGSFEIFDTHTYGQLIKRQK